MMKVAVRMTTLECLRKIKSPKAKPGVETVVRFRF